MKMNTVGPSDSVDGINEESPPVFVVDPEAGSSNQQETNNSCLPLPEDQIRWSKLQYVPIKSGFNSTSSFSTGLITILIHSLALFIMSMFVNKDKKKYSIAETPSDWIVSLLGTLKLQAT